MRRAERFKHAYKPQWWLSNQKEAFIRLLLTGWGYKVKAIGIGVESRKYSGDTGSPPDFVVLDPFTGEEIAYIEVTGGNRGIESPAELWVSLDKFRKYFSYRAKRPVYFVYLGFLQGKLSLALYTEYENLYPYAEKKDHIRRIKPYGITEYYIATPRRIWQPLYKLQYELAPFRRTTSITPMR